MCVLQQLEKASSNFFGGGEKIVQFLKEVAALTSI